MNFFFKKKKVISTNMKFKPICVKAQTIETKLNQTKKCWFGFVGLDLPTSTRWFDLSAKLHLRFSLSKECSNKPNQTVITATVHNHSLF